jgi:NMD protein affecting ribosome stability and mRNA decay
MMDKRVPSTTKQSKGLIRSLSRAAVRDDKSPQVVRKTGKYQEPTICERCGSIFLRKTWRAHFQLSAAELARAKWSVCPACLQVSREEGQGRVLIRGSGALQQEETVRRRIQNVAGRATRSQPQRRIVSIDWVDNNGRALQVITTSQKLAHRIVHELNKLFRGATSYSWGDDGTLLATWDYELPKAKPKKSAKPMVKKSPPPKPKKRAGR